MNKKMIRLAFFTFAFVMGQFVWASASQTTDTSTNNTSTNGTSTNGTSTDSANNASNTTSDNCHAQLQKMLQSLNLDSNQQSKINAIIEQTKTNNAPYKQQLRALHDQIKQLITADNLDESQLDDLISKKKELIGSLIKNKIMAKYQIYQVLNAQQKAQFQQLMNNWEQKHFGS